MLTLVSNDNNKQIGVPGAKKAMTRWNVLVKIARWQIKNRFALKQVAVLEEAKDYVCEKLDKIVLDSNYWKNLQLFMKYGAIICDNTDVFQNPKTSLSEVKKRFVDMEKYFASFSEHDEVALVLQQSVKTRWELISDGNYIHTACFLVDIRYVNDELDEKDQEKGEEALKNLFFTYFPKKRNRWDQVQSQYLDFRGKAGIFAKPSFKMYGTDHLKCWRWVKEVFQKCNKLNIETHFRIID